ncbi:MAG: hypothetical protein ABSC47_12995 [Terracidiphilus sp.]|jgi:hypothetical protein
MMKFMRVLTFSLLAPVVFTGALTAQTNPEPPKFTIVISPDKSEVNLGSDIAIAITITNISEESLTFSFGYHGRMPDGYHFDMRDEQDAKVAKFGPRYRRLPNGNMFRLPDRPAGSMRWGAISPGKSVEEHATISDDYNFDHPGKYTIRVWKPATMGIPDKPELNRVYSNTITVTVVVPTPEAETPK